MSRKQIVLSVIGVLIGIILLVMLGNMYGGFLKTQVAVPSSANTGSVKSSVLKDSGQYTLRFEGQGPDGKAIDATTSFQVAPK